MPDGKGMIMAEIKRVMLKLSGEALQDEHDPFNEKEVQEVAKQVKALYDKKVDIGVVIGGGNIWRGITGTEIDRPKSDSIGMLATVMNAVYVSEFFRQNGMPTAILSPMPFANITEQFSKDKALEYFGQGKVIFFAGGTGHPYFSTDTAMALRAVETEADVILAAKNIDGVYDMDPALHPEAKRFDKISIDEVVQKELGVIDLTASILLKNNRIPMRIFNLKGENSIANAVNEVFDGTEVTV